MMHTIPNRRYTVEFQEAAIQQVLDSGRSINEVAGSLEMLAKTLANWVRRVRRGQRLSNGGRQTALTDVQAELSRLRAENAQLKLDKEILKKAAFFKISRSIWSRRFAARNRCSSACSGVWWPLPGNATDPSCMSSRFHRRSMSRLIPKFRGILLFRS